MFLSSIQSWNRFLFRSSALFIHFEFSTEKFLIVSLKLFEFLERFSSNSSCKILNDKLIFIEAEMNRRVFYAFYLSRTEVRSRSLDSKSLSRAHAFNFFSNLVLSSFKFSFSFLLFRLFWSSSFSHFKLFVCNLKNLIFLSNGWNESKQIKNSTTVKINDWSSSPLTKLISYFHWVTKW